VIRIQYARLPGGVRVLASRDQRGRLVIVVNSALPHATQREAIRTVRRAAARKGWLPGLAVTGSAALAAARHPAAFIFGAAIVTGTAAAVAIAVVPHAVLQPVRQATPAVTTAAGRHGHRRGERSLVLPPASRPDPRPQAPSPAASQLPGPLPSVIRPVLPVPVPSPSLPPLPLPLPSVCVSALGIGTCLQVARAA
jgi:hypothetical protein